MPLLISRWLAALVAALALAGIAHAQVADDRLAVEFPGGEPPARVGRLSFMSNTVSLRTRLDEAWTAATLNYPITTGTAVWTEPNALAELRIGDAAIRLNNGTELEFIDLDDRQVRAVVRQGGLNVQIRTLTGGDRFAISTPRVTIDLAGAGTYRIDAGTESEPTRVAVFGTGIARVSGNGPAATVRPGELVLIRGDDRVVYEVRDGSPDSFDRWAMARDPIDRPVVSAGYVAPGTTGYEDLDHYGTWAVEPAYGPIWSPTVVPVGWVPYRFGHWAFVWPWGWTWIDHAPWGFTPFHYGRWVFVHSRWCWTPGHRGPRAVFAPALVAFLGHGGTPGVAWFPLGPHDRFRPWYKTGARHQDNINAGAGAAPAARVEHQNVRWASALDARDFARGKPAHQVPQTRIMPAVLQGGPTPDVKPDLLPRPERRVERTAAVPPAVTWRNAQRREGDDTRRRDDPRPPLPEVRRGDTRPEGGGAGAVRQPTVVTPDAAGPSSQRRGERQRQDRRDDRGAVKLPGAAVPPDANTPQSNSASRPGVQVPSQLNQPVTRPFSRREEQPSVRREDNWPARRQETPLPVPRAAPPPAVQNAPVPQFRPPHPVQPPPQPARQERRRDQRFGV